MAENYLQTYIDELSLIEPCTPEENSFLADRLLKGDDSVQMRLIEGNLRFALERAIPYENSGAPTEDLVAEANLALTNAVKQYAEEGVKSDFEEFIAGAVDKAIEAFIEEEGKTELAAGKLEDESNRLMEVIRDFEEEHDRAATPEELAEQMHLDVDEVERLVRISHSAIKLASGD